MNWPDPWWITLLALVPFCGALWWWRRGLDLPRGRLVVSGLWGLAFGAVEASVVVYLRAVYATLLGHPPTLAAIGGLSNELAQESLLTMPGDLLRLEVWREAATLVMLATVALLAARRWRERWAVFLWVFAAWDLAYYAGLWLTIRWPPSWLTLDVLFLIPRPWIAQVWYPVAVSGLTMAAIVARSRGRQKDP